MSSSQDITRASLVARVTVLDGFARGDSFLVERFPAIIGRGEEADVRLRDDPDDPTLSRKHLRLSIGSGRLKVQDLSTNGTTVGSRMLEADEQCQLGDSDVILLGPRTRIRVESLRSGMPELPAEHPVLPTPLPPPEATGSGLRIQALGPFRAFWGRQPIPDSAWDTRKPILLLTYLAWQGGRAVSAERLCNDLWPDHAQGGRQALQSTLARLRRALRGAMNRDVDPVLFERGAYRLNPALAILFDVAELQSACQKSQGSNADDEARLEALRRVQELYAGAFLEGYTDDWACVRRQDVDQQYHQAMADLGDLLRRRGGSAEAVRLYRQILDHEPCWELGHQGLVQALVDQGLRDEAVKHYHRYVETLKTQLGLAPSPDMMRLYYSVLQS